MPDNTRWSADDQSSDLRSAADRLPSRPEETAERQRAIQAQVDAEDRSFGEAKTAQAKAAGAMQAGARRYPERMPAQHQAKPGSEADLDLKPMYDAPYYRGSGKLEGKRAIITGGDSGIGRSVAVLYAREGADIAIIYLDEHDDAEETRRAVEAEGRRCLLIPGDVRERDFCIGAVDRAVSELGGLDILVNNAAFQVHEADFENLTEEHFDETLKTNLYGYFHMAQAAVKHLKPGSAIVNSGSVTGLMGNKDLLDYSMTKGGIHAFTRSLSTHLIPKGIRVNAVAPGPVWTPLNPSDKAAEEVETFGADTPWAALPSRKRSRPPTSSWPPPSSAPTSPARSCR
jgi:hypothetical protein